MKKVLLAAFYFIAITGNADAALTTVDKTRFTPFEPSFILPSQKATDFQGTKDENAIEAHYSFQYIVFNCNYAFDPSNNCTKKKDTFELSLSYTGEFDFYMGSRESGPVINRISNPALNLSWKTKEDHWKSKYFSLSKLGFSFEHRSNGQVVNANKKETDINSTDYGKYLTQIAYENGDHEYFDALSRGANYLTLKSKFHAGNGSDSKDMCDTRFLCADFWLSYKVYITNDSNITWGALAGSNTSIKDYDIVRLIVSDTFEFPGTKYQMTLEVDYTVGDQLEKTDSYDINIITPVSFGGLNIPILFRYHNGPMDRLSDYTREYETFGVGLIFNH